MSMQQQRLQAIERQRQRLQIHNNTLDKLSNLYGWIRVSIFFAAIIIALCLGFLLNWWVGVGCLLVLMLVFGVVVYYHRQIDHSLVRHQLWLHLKTTEIARMRRDWSSIPDAYTPAQEIEHPFESDLDITGRHSLHRLLNTAVSRGGTERLRAWLLTTTPDLATIQARQELLQELVPMSAFRTRLTMKALLAAKSTHHQIEGDRLLLWLSKPSKVTGLLPLIVCAHTLTLLILMLFLCNLFGLLPPYWIMAVVAGFVFVMTTKERRGNLFEDAYYLRDAFAQLHAVFAYLESYRYGQKQRLRQLCQPFFATRPMRPSLLLKKIQQVANGATLESNGLIWLLVNLIFPWDFYLALRFNRYRAQVAEQLPVWLERWFELEALCSLATFAYLHPDYTLPQLHEGIDEQHPVPFCARKMGHPLLPEETKVVNDFTMEQIGETALFTGSNMAGKSTFLRTTGVNLCLAYAGGPVDATAFTAALFRIFTCIKISDSVTEGYSYFYAEVRRLRALLNLLEPSRAEPPLFFLIDEIFRGTNNRERRIGSEAYIHALSGQNCLGLLSTHDLDLVKLDRVLPQIKNYHFKEEVVDGQMSFDYILRSGPCPTTNALKIMQMEGLPIDAVSEELA